MEYLDGMVGGWLNNVSMYEFQLVCIDMQTGIIIIPQFIAKLLQWTHLKVWHGI